MKRLLTLAAFAVATATPAFAASHKEAPGMAKGASAPMASATAMPMKTAQQNKMATCNTKAEGKKGDERKMFMKECLSGEKMTQQNKMKTCNADAKGKTGDARKAFMKECLSA